MKKQVYVTIYKDYVVTENDKGIFHTYYVKEFKFHEKAEKAIPALSVEILKELYQLQDLDYEITFRYGKEK